MAMYSDVELEKLMTDLESDLAERKESAADGYERWMGRIPGAYWNFVLSESAGIPAATDDDPNCLATLKHFRSLMPLAQEARKPMFALKPADGAIGGHVHAVRTCYRDFRALAREVALRCKVPSPDFETMSQ